MKDADISKVISKQKLKSDFYETIKMGFAKKWIRAFDKKRLPRMPLFHPLLIFPPKWFKIAGKKMHEHPRSPVEPQATIHILNNLEQKDKSPRYELGSLSKLYTPEWTFDWRDLKRFSK